MNSGLHTLKPSLLQRLLEDGQPPPGRRIFVNRILRFASIRTIGFDLDWTLADYQRPPLERLTFDQTVERLIEHNDYPEAIRQAELRPDFPRRGLLIDKDAGTVLRMSRHRFVNRAYHGRRRLDRDELRKLYRFEPIEPASDRFYHLDSLFELPEANLYAELIELRQSDSNLQAKSPRELFTDLRAAIDWVHASGAMKSRIMAEPSRYLIRDPDLGLALCRLAMGGRRLFLLTNSDWDYASVLCSYLFDGLLPGLDSWRQLFDLVIVGARKPSFFRRRDPFDVLDDKGAVTAPQRVPEWGRAYRGGCLEGLMELIDEPGERVLYVGDHIYGDIVSSKLQSTWRTALITHELEEEIEIVGELQEELEQQIQLKRGLAALGHRMDHLRDILALSDEVKATKREPSARSRSIRNEFEQVRQQHSDLLRKEGRYSDRLAGHFNPYWGSFFKQGTIKTRFASQLETYACLYTSRVSNFLYYGSNHYFRVTRDPMMHETEGTDLARDQVRKTDD